MFFAGVEATPVREWHNHPPCPPSPALQTTQFGASVDKLRARNTPMAELVEAMSLPAPHDFLAGAEAIHRHNRYFPYPCPPSPALQKTQCGASVDKLMARNTPMAELVEAMSLPAPHDFLAGVEAKSRISLARIPRHAADDVSGKDVTAQPSCFRPNATPLQVK